MDNSLRIKLTITHSTSLVFGFPLCLVAKLERRLPFQYVCCTQVFLCRFVHRMCIGFERDGALEETFAPRQQTFRITQKGLGPSAETKAPKFYIPRINQAGHFRCSCFAHFGALVLALRFSPTHKNICTLIPILDCA